jgi:hypothetical protein
MAYVKRKVGFRYQSHVRRHFTAIYELFYVYGTRAEFFRQLKVIQTIGHAVSRPGTPGSAILVKYDLMEDVVGRIVSTHCAQSCGYFLAAALSEATMAAIGMVTRRRFKFSK